MKLISLLFVASCTITTGTTDCGSGSSSDSSSDDNDCIQIIDFEDAVEAGFLSVEADIIFSIPDGYYGLKWNVDGSTRVLNVSKPFVQNLSPNIVDNLDTLGSFILFNGWSLTITIGEVGDGTTFEILSFDTLGNWDNEDVNLLTCVGYLGNERVGPPIEQILNYTDIITITVDEPYEMEQFTCNTSLAVLGQVVMDNIEIIIHDNATNIDDSEDSDSDSDSDASED